MTYAAAKAYLTTYRPPVVDSAQEFGDRFRLANRTVTDLLGEMNYLYEVDHTDRRRWVRHESQFDRIEGMLTQILNILGKAVVKKPEPKLVQHPNRKTALSTVAPTPEDTPDATPLPSNPTTEDANIEAVLKGAGF